MRLPVPGITIWTDESHSVSTPAGPHYSLKNSMQLDGIPKFDSSLVACIDWQLAMSSLPIGTDS